MSEPTSQPPRPATTADTTQEGPEDTEPSPERQAELRAAYEANMAAGGKSYEGVHIRTPGELRWIMRERQWSSDLRLPPGHGRADLSGADLSDASLNGANLYHANLSGALLLRANLSGALLLRANLSGANLDVADLSEANLSYAKLRGARLHNADLSWASLGRANLSGANLDVADLREANLIAADLSNASLKAADLSEANLSDAKLSWANLFRADLSGANLIDAKLSGANLSAARMDAATGLRDAHLDTHTLLADVVWNGVPLTRLKWEEVDTLGEEQVARNPKDTTGKRKKTATRVYDFTDAVLAYRQVATVLRSQGLNEHADRFSYRAQLCQRRLLRLQRHYLRYLGSLLLGLIAGYGYRPLRSFATYLLVVIVFT